MAACIAPLTLTPERLARQVFWLHEVDGRVVGSYGLDVTGGEAELTHLFVDPSSIGRGHGRELWQHAVEQARIAAARRLRAESDPNAEPFYRAMGAVWIGEAPSEAVPGRMLPVLVAEIEVDAAAAANENHGQMRAGTP